RYPAVGGQQLVVRTPGATYDDLFVPLFGEHAARNAAAALTAVETLFGRELSADAVRAALASASSPGRLEVISRQPLIVLDGAHNPAGAEALAAALSEAFTWERLHLILAISANKDVEGIARELAPLADRVYATRNRSERSADVERTHAAVAALGKDVVDVPSVPEALEAARGAAGPGDLIVVTGSLYTVADARRALLGES
ncbi:MAG: glutamate ligase domain-containing protein, partial [Actinomycetota bacterium]